LILTEGDEEIGEGLFGNVANADGFSEGNEDGVTSLAAIAGVEFGSPKVEEGEGGFGVADFVAEVVRDAAISVDGVEVGAKALRKKPGSYVEIFVMGFGEVAAPGAGFLKGRRYRRDAVVRGKGGPSLFEQFLACVVVCDINRHWHGGSLRE
jgi:hypothetical protein